MRERPGINWYYIGLLVTIVLFWTAVVYGLTVWL